MEINQNRMASSPLEATETVDKRPLRYARMTSSAMGAIAVFHILGDEAELARTIDARVRPGMRSPAAGNPLANNEVRYGWLAREDGETVDEVLLLKPGENLRILTSHGGIYICECVADFLTASGLAEVSPAEADDLGWPGNTAADRFFASLLPACHTESQVAALLAARAQRPDLYDVATWFAALARTRNVVLAGPPNAGKSSIMNCLLGYDRAFVHEEAGATRDAVDELVDIGGLSVMLHDLPGWRSEGEIDLMAWKKASARLASADLALFVVDASAPWDEETDATAGAVVAAMGAREVGAPVIMVLNKADCPRAMEGSPWIEHFLPASIATTCSLPKGDARKELLPLIAALLEPSRYLLFKSR